MRRCATKKTATGGVGVWVGIWRAHILFEELVERL